MHFSFFFFFCPAMCIKASALEVKTDGRFGHSWLVCSSGECLFFLMKDSWLLSFCRLFHIVRNVFQPTFPSHVFPLRDWITFLHQVMKTTSQNA